MDDEQRGSTSSVNFDILSVGTADEQPVTKHQAHVVDNAGTSTPRPLNTDMDQHTLPSPNFSRLSPLRPFSRRSENARPRPISPGTMEYLRRPAQDSNRRPIIDPATVRLSFTGSISDMGSPLALPLEEGLQKLYKLYNEHTNPSAPLPYTLSITEIPLTTIADALASHIQSQASALLDCANNLHAMTNLHEKLKKDLVILEQHYSLAVEKANIAAMSTDDVRRRLGWQIEEIIRINTERENAINEAGYHSAESQRLSAELQGMADTLRENERLREESEKNDREKEKLTREVEQLKCEMEETRVDLQVARQKLESVPKPIKRLYGRFADSGKDRKRLSRNGKAKDTRTGVLIPASPRTSSSYC